jgi:type IV secretion system protein VirB10
MTERDVIDNAPADLSALAGDVRGPGVVEKNVSAADGGISIHARPSPAKGISKKGLMIVGFAGMLIVALMLVGIVSTGAPTAQTSNTSEDKTSSAVSAAGSAINTAEAAEAAKKNAAPTQSVPTVAAPAAAGAGSAAPADQSRPPTPKEQYAEWLEKHYYDILRAKHLAAEQARTAGTLTESSGSMRAVAARGAAPAVAQHPGVDMLAALQAAAQAAGARATAADDRQRVMTAALETAAAVSPRQIPAFAPTGPTASAARPGATTQQPGYDARDAFVEEQSKTAGVGYLDARVTDKRPGHEVTAGSVIPAVMLTGINSDLPGTIVAQTRENVYSTYDYRTLLIPAGSRLVGTYSSDIVTGQERLLVAWNELIFPSGRRIALGGMQGADEMGRAGFKDEVHTHFWRTWGNALLVSMLGVGVQRAQPANANQNNTPTAAQQSAAAVMNSLNETANKVLQRNLNISPTLEIRPGYAFNVIVSKSISLPAYVD